MIKATTSLTWVKLRLSQPSEIQELQIASRSKELPSTSSDKTLQGKNTSRHKVSTHETFYGFFHYLPNRWFASVRWPRVRKDRCEASSFHPFWGCQAKVEWFFFGLILLEGQPSNTRPFSNQNKGHLGSRYIIYKFHMKGRAWGQQKHHLQDASWPSTLWASGLKVPILQLKDSWAPHASDCSEGASGIRHLQYITFSKCALFIAICHIYPIHSIVYWLIDRDPYNDLLLKPNINGSSIYPYIP